MSPDSPLTRRSLLSGVATLGVASLAGCVGARGIGSSGSISSESLHWHVNLAIEINGESYTVPKNVGIGTQYSTSPYYQSGMKMTSIHTHDDSGTIHWEIMSRPPKEGELQLGAFFDIWGKPFSETQIFDYRNDAENEVTMTVNGMPNDEFATYEVDDGDEIAIQYD